DLHGCLNAARREREFAPRLNKVIEDLRAAGAIIIHAPSGCMSHYQEHPARLRAQSVPMSKSLPPQIGAWCYSIPAEEAVDYPLDQTDGGRDDAPQEAAEWAAQLAAMGADSLRPWTRQIDLISIDGDRDYISDSGEEIWSLLEHRGISNVILAGVHTNMCVLGRPFGLRQMAKNGKNVVLLRDLTDTMYNPARAPYVSHFSGNDLIVSHIERHVCPTITSDQFLGGSPFRFRHDTRPHLVVMMAEDEYKTEETLPKFVLEELQRDFRVTYLFGSETNRHEIPGMTVLADADLLLVSVRRRLLPVGDMEILKHYVASGRPVLGIRTASHAFSVKEASLPEGLADWKSFDADLFGGNYHGHHGNTLKSTVRVVSDQPGHPLLTGVPMEPFAQGWSLYQTSPLAPGTTILMTATLDDGSQPEEPIAWTFTRRDGGRSFYTSLGSVSDFDQPGFRTMLINAAYWAVDRLPSTSTRPQPMTTP
ncbi:MAG: ThuA domain-containing protein, partial [Planctomycetaceae bacterium]